jgi:hypothetical protein
LLCLKIPFFLPERAGKRNEKIRRYMKMKRILKKDWHKYLRYFILSLTLVSYFPLIKPPKPL